MTDLEMIQAQLPWGVNEYCDAFKAADLPHKDFQHALIHILKAMGKLSIPIENADHAQPSFFPPPEFVGKYLADIVICAVRMANTNPSGQVELGRAVLDRIEEKMGVRLKPEGTE